MINWSEEQKQYQEFLATPRSLRKSRFGVDTKSDFANKLGKHVNTLSYWEKQPGWVESINQFAVLAQHHRLGDLYEAIFDKAIIEKDVKAMRLASEIGMNMLNKMVIQEGTIVSPQSTSEEKLLSRLKDILLLAQSNQKDEKEVVVEYAND